MMGTELAPFDWTLLDVPIVCDCPDCEATAAWIATWVTRPLACGSCWAAELICHAHFVQVTVSINTGGTFICRCPMDVGLTRDLVSRIEPL